MKWCCQLIVVLSLFSLPVKAASPALLFAGDHKDQEAVTGLPFQKNPGHAGHNAVRLTDPVAGAVTRVSVGVQLLQVEAIHETTESYEFKLFIDLRWNDPRLAYDEDVYGPRQVFIEEHAEDARQRIWWPDLEIRNERHPPQVENQELIVYPNGDVEYEELIDVDLATHMNLRMFPYDSQVFPVEFESFAYDSTQVEFVVNEELDALAPSFFVDGWELLDVSSSSRLVLEARSDKEFSVVEVSFAMKRDSGFYVWRFFLPLFMFLLMAWMMFWMSDTLDTRGNVSLFALMIVIFYHGFLASELPRVSYLSVMDIVIILCYMMLAFAVLLETYRSRLKEVGNEERRAKLNRFSRRFFPLTTAGGWLLLLLFSLL